MTVHTCARSKMPQYNIVNNVLVIFPWLVSRQQYVHQQETIDTTGPQPDGGMRALNGICYHQLTKRT